MGAVYKAEDLKLDRPVALKTIRRELADNAQVMQRFKQELILAREVSHQNVVRLYDIGEADGIDFITMEFVEGQDLGAILLRNGKMPPREAADIVSQICSGLQAAHAKGIIHRDLKPGNVMRDGSGRIVLMDFGLARTLESTGMTQTGALVGTVEYMSPEQAKSASIDGRSDLFTVGLIFYELLTGVRPYQADSAIASLLKRTQERAQPPITRDGSIPPLISDICAKCLEVDPANRYQSATDIVADLAAWNAGLQPPSSRLVSAEEVLVLSRKRVLWRGIAIAAVVIAVAAIAAVLYLRPRSTTAAHAPISVLVADFTNRTGEPVFDNTLEPMLNVALEGASFVNAFDRGQARRLASKLPAPTDKLTEEPARLVAVSQGLSAVVIGELSRRGSEYNIAATALDAVSGNVLAKAEVTAANKDDVLRAIPKLAVPIRKALGDTTPESVQFEAVAGGFTAASLEAVHQNAIAMDQQFAGNFEEALKSFGKAVELDPNFARAYSGMAAMAGTLGRMQDAEKYMNLAMQHMDRMTERERYRTRGLFYAMSGNSQKCIEEYTQLISRYPADRIGQLNLAGCYAQLRNIPKSIEAAKRAVEIVPKGVFQRLNLSFLSSFGGDFQSGEREAHVALDLNPSSEVGYLVLGEAQLGQQRLRETAETYQKLEKLSGRGASMAASALGDLAWYEGRFKDAVRTLEQGITADLAAKNSDAAADKYAALGYVRLSMRENGAALAAADKAINLSQALKIKFLAAQIFVECGQIAKAEKLAGSLASDLKPEPQAYAKIIQGEAALKRGDAQQAVKTLTEANNQLDTWIGRFALGRAYLEAGALIEADSEFDRCISRRGEALEFFIDNVPTYGFLPLVYYYQGRVRQGVKSPAFADSYRAYLGIRGQASEDPLLAEVHQRLGQ